MVCALSFFYLEDGDNRIDTELNVLIVVQALEQCLAYSKHSQNINYYSFLLCHLLF